MEIEPVRGWYAGNCSLDFIPPAFRKKGEKILHSKYIVICVIILTITDCALVIAELILDLYSVKKTLSASEAVTNFVEDLRGKYPKELSSSMTVDTILNMVLQSTVHWNLTGFAIMSQPHRDAPIPSVSGHATNGRLGNDTRTRSVRDAVERDSRLRTSSSDEGLGKGPEDIRLASIVSGAAASSLTSVLDTVHSGLGLHSGNWTNVSASASYVGMGVAYAEYSTTAGQNLPDRGHGQYPDQQRHHSAETLIAHKLHYASLAVVSVLLVEVALKMMCSGSHFVKRKIEVFDAVIILASFVVDLVFIKGVPVFVVDESIFILAFLLPWRVIRVVNSLVVAVIDHEHVKLRLLYSRKKKLDKTVETLKNEVDELKGLLQDVRSLCLKEGLESWKIDNLLGKFAPRRRKDSKFYALVKLVMSTASVTDDRDSISSSSIENDIRAIANRDSVLNINDCSTSNDNTISSFNFLNVQGNYDIRSVASDVESYKDGYSSHSASPSPVVSPEISPCPSPNVFLRVPGGPSVFRFDDTQSMMSDELASRPSTPNILLTAPSTENTCDIEAMAETSLNSAPDGRTLGVGKEGARSGSGGGARNETKTLKKGKAAKLHTPPSTPFLTVPNSHGRGHKPRISDSHSLTDLQFASRMPSRRSSCLSLNAEARGRRQKSPRRVNFDLS